MTFDMRSRRFWNKSDTSWKYPAKIFVRRSIFHRNTIYRSVIIEVNWSPQISAHKEDGVSFSLLVSSASRKTVSASAVNLLRRKRKKRTLAETLIFDPIETADGWFKKKMHPKCDIGGQISKLLYHYLFYILLTREHHNFRNKYWFKNKI